MLAILNTLSSSRDATSIYDTYYHSINIWELIGTHYYKKLEYKHRYIPHYKIILNKKIYNDL